MKKEETQDRRSSRVVPAGSSTPLPAPVATVVEVPVAEEAVVETARVWRVVGIMRLAEVIADDVVLRVEVAELVRTFDESVEAARLEVAGTTEENEITARWSFLESTVQIR
jgi:hypothetical protein